MNIDRPPRVYCDVCRELVLKSELRQQDGVCKCRRCRRAHSVADQDEYLRNTNSGVPLLAKFGGTAKIFRE